MNKYIAKNWHRFITVLVLLIGVRCTQPISDEASKVKIRINGFPSTLNPILSNSYEAYLIQKNIFTSLLSFEGKGVVKPLAAKKLPQGEIHEGLTYVTYDIYENATWDDGSSISYADIEFSLKVYKLPVAANRKSRAFYDPILNVELEADKENVVTFVGRGNISDLINLTGDLGLLKKDSYDPDQLLDAISLESIHNGDLEPIDSARLSKFMTNFSEGSFHFKDEYYSSAGPFKISKVVDGAYVNLVRKNNWWGNFRLNQKHLVKELTYVKISEDIIALEALKNKEIDIVDGISAINYTNLSQVKSDEFNLFAPLSTRFVYIGLNSRIQKLEDPNVRKAIAHLINVDELITGLEIGMAQPTIGPVSPAIEYFYNHDVRPFSYSTQKAKDLLKEAGFVFKDDNWQHPNSEENLSFEILCRSSALFQSIGAILVEELKKIGIEATLKPLDSRTARSRTRSHNFEITIGAFTGNPYSLNFSELFSQDAGRLNGMNYTGFGNQKSDSLLNVINYAVDSVSKQSAAYALQQILHDEATMIFLYFTKNKIAISSRFEESSLKISGVKPGYDVTSFRLKEEFQ